MLTLLIIGDVITLILVTVFGFSTHGELSTAGTRIFATLIPLLLAWFLAAPAIGAYNINWAVDLRQLWRPFWAMVLAGPLAAWMRGMWLGAPIIPIFVLVLGGISALAILTWRIIFWLLISQRKRAHG